MSRVHRAALQLPRCDICWDCGVQVLRVLWDLSCALESRLCYLGHQWGCTSSALMGSLEEGRAGHPSPTEARQVFSLKKLLKGVRRVGKTLLGIHLFFCFPGSGFHTHWCVSCTFQGVSCAKTVCACTVRFGTYFTY